MKDVEDAVVRGFEPSILRERRSLRESDSVTLVFVFFVVRFLEAHMRTAIVTGGTRGIGRAIAAAILGEGGRVMITGRDDRRVGDAVAALSANAPDRVAGAAVDVRDRAAVERLMADIGGQVWRLRHAGEQRGHRAISRSRVDDR